MRNVKVKLLILLLIIGGLWEVSLSYNQSIPVLALSPAPHPSKTLSPLKVSPPISIYGDTDFANQAMVNGWLGNGSKSNPYIIKDLIIDGGGKNNGISISNTKVYFKLSNNTITNTSRGIFLYFSGNSTVNGNFVNKTRDYGVFLYFSGNSTVSGNTVSNSNTKGIFLYSSHNSTISGNRINSSNQGIYLYSSNSLVIKGNLFTNCNESLYLLRSQDSQLIQNIFCRNCFPIVDSGLRISYRFNLMQPNNTNDMTFLEKSSGHTLNWTILDDKPGTYILYKNSTIFKSGTWSSGVATNVSFDGLTHGTYNMTIVFTNGYGDSVSYLIWVNVLYNPNLPTPSPTPTTPEPSPTPTPTPNPTPTTPVPSSTPTITPPTSTPTLPIPGFLLILTLAVLIFVGVSSKKRKRLRY